MADRRRVSVPCPWCGHELDHVQPGALCACVNCLNPSFVPEDGVSEPKMVGEMGDARDAALSSPAVAEVVSRLYGVIRALPVLPEIPQRVISLLHDPLASLEEVARVTNEDAVLTMQMLHVANSAAYGGRTEVRDLRVACARLGLKTVANLMWAAVNRSLYRQGPTEFRDWVVRLWDHSLATAQCADWLAATLGMPKTPTWFVAAIVHDVGKLVLLEVMRHRPSPAIRALARSPEAVLRLFDTYHALAGLHVVQYMEMPLDLRATTFFHHSPDSALHFARQAHVVAYADHLARVAGHGSGTEAPDPTVAHPSAAALDLKDHQIRELQRQIGDHLESVLSTFALM